MNYADWVKYRPRTREIIRNGSPEQGVIDPYVVSNTQYRVTENSGYTYKGRKSELRPQVKSRIDYFLISEALYDYVSEAKINEEELATTDHKMIVMTICLNQFAQGM